MAADSFPHGIYMEPVSLAAIIPNTSQETLVVDNSGYSLEYLDSDDDGVVVLEFAATGYLRRIRMPENFILRSQAIVLMNTPAILFLKERLAGCQRVGKALTMLHKGQSM